MKLFNDNSTILTVFINKGETALIKVPLGQYEISMAIGDTWYGDQYLFGPATQYMKYDKVYIFYIDSKGYQGWELYLKTQVDGNVKSEYISKDEFN